MDNQVAETTLLPHTRFTGIPPKIFTHSSVIVFRFVSNPLSPLICLFKRPENKVGGIISRDGKCCRKSHAH